MIAQLNFQVRRYDYAYWREAGDVSISHEQHAQILDALDTGDLNRASELLRMHWLSGMEPVVRWLKQSAPGEAGVKRT